MTTFTSLRFWQMATAFCAVVFFTETIGAQAPVKLDPPVKPSVSGKFIGNGKEAAVKFVLVEEHEEFSGEEVVSLIFTEKDPAKVKKPSFDAIFGKLGSSLMLKVQYDGDIIGCQVSHSAHQKQGFNSLGEIKMVEFAIVGGNVKGHVSTNGMRDAFGEKWEVDLTFAAPLPEKLRNAPAKPKPTATPVAVESEEAAKEETPKAPAGPVIEANKLPLPTDATDVQFKKTVEHIQFSSARPVDVVAKEFSAKLKQQGWKDGRGNLMGKTNAILKRELGDAKLTIMVQPAPVGCVVKIFTEGLDWSNTEEVAEKPAASGKSAKDEIESVEKKAENALKDALKDLPAGFR